MKTAKVFYNGRSQAVRLPKEFRIKGNEVKISKVGDTIVLSPIVDSWDVFIKSLDEFTPDFMDKRNQPFPDKREDMF